MLPRIKMPLATALILGAASAALAGSENTEDRGGFVMPGSMVGVNPVYHPDIFGNVAVAKAYGFVQDSDHTWHVRSTWQRQPMAVRRSRVPGRVP
jgi:hypothetical protein